MVAAGAAPPGVAVSVVTCVVSANRLDPEELDV
jgi:hypothetical protein